MCAVLDANVLYPAPLRDLFMHLAVVSAFQARWSEEIHAEWMRNVLANRPDLSLAQIERTRVLMNTHAEGSLVIGYAHHIASLSLPDPDDRHVLAAAIEAKATVIVTWNAKDFPASILSSHGVTRQDPDTFLCALYDRDAGRVCEAVRNQRRFLRNPTKTVDEHMATLTQNGVNNFVARLAAHLPDL